MNLYRFHSKKKSILPFDTLLLQYYSSVTYSTYSTYVQQLLDVQTNQLRSIIHSIVGHIHPFNLRIYIYHITITFILMHLPCNMVHRIHEPFIFALLVMFTFIVSPLLCVPIEGKTLDTELSNCATLPLTIHINKEELDPAGNIIRNCEGTFTVNKCEGTCISTLQPSVVHPSGFLKVRESKKKEFHPFPEEQRIERWNENQ